MLLSSRAARRWLALGLGLLGVTLAAVGCGDDDTTATTGGTGSADAELNVRIGFPGDFSGDFAGTDVPLLNGMKFAAEQINAEGGDVTVEIVDRDIQGQQGLAATETQAMLDDGVRLFAITVSAPGQAEGQLISQGGGITSVGLNTSPLVVRDIGEAAFMAVFGDNVQGSASAEYACDQGYESAWVLSAPENPYTKFLPVYWSTAFEQCGGTVAGTDIYKIGATEYGAQVTKIANASPKPDVIFTPAFVPDLGIFVKQLRAAGVTTPVISADGADSAQLEDSGGAAIDGLVFTTHGYPSPGTPMAKFVDEYTELMGKKPESNTYEAAGRDQVYLYVEAVKKAGSTDPQKVMDALLGLPFEGVTGRATVDPETRIADTEVTLIQVDGTQFKPIDRVTPSYIVDPYEGL